MIPLVGTERLELDAALAQAERLAAQGCYAAGQELLVQAVTHHIHAAKVNGAKETASLDAWAEALRRYVARHDPVLLDFDRID